MVLVKVLTGCMWASWYRRTVHSNADAGSVPSWGSVPEPWRFTAWPSRYLASSGGWVIVAVGRLLPTSIWIVSEAARSLRAWE